jgi:succinate-semialdehyde dehydrogenase/glutarate-semialdehyde dehydrogenase
VAIRSVDPATGRVLKTFTPHGDAEVDARIARAALTFSCWRLSPPAKRAGLLGKVADLLDAEVEPLARLVTMEMGRPIRAARDEIRKCAFGCRYYAEHGPRLLADEPIPTGPAETWVRYEPLGPVLAIMPWNFPFWQVFRFAAPALVAGNVGLLKHASNVPQCALAIEDVFLRAGVPEGVFQTLLVEASAVGRVLDDRRVVAATLTGSTAAGAKVAAAAGARLKKTVLELGGSDPFVVMPSADLPHAVETAVRARTVNAGQSCVAAKRFIVGAAIADQFENRFVAAMQALRVGDPRDERTEVGPLATPQILEELHAQVERSVAAGARVRCGGHRLEGGGNFYAPTVLTDVPPDAPVLREEVFGPVAAVVRVADVDEAIRAANDTTFGLGASVWTSDPAERERLIADLTTGMVFVNGMVASDPRLPFGGVKESGYGRELGPWGLREFVNVKTVSVAGHATPDVE